MTRSPWPQRRTSDNGDAVMGSSRRPAASYVHGLEGPTRYTAARPFVRLWRSQWALTKDATVAPLVKEHRATMAAALAGVADAPHALDKFRGRRDRNRSAMRLRLRAVGVALTRARRAWGFLQVGRRGPSHMTSTIPAATRPGGVAAQAGDLPTYRQSGERTAPAGPRSASTPQAIHRRRKSTRTRALFRALSS